MADVPTLIVEIGFTAALTGTAFHLDDSARGVLDTNTLAAADLFVDVSEFVTNVTTFRGARRTDVPIVSYETGTATITFRNDDRRFDPTHLSGPYVAGGVTQVEPMRAVRIRATHNGVTWALWRGFTNEWTVGYDGPNSSWAQVTCFDAFGVLAAHNRAAGSSVGAGDTTGARLDRILDGISWPAGDRMISTGLETVQATTLDGNVLSEMQLNADTELGELWTDAEGRVTFRDREASYTDTRSTLAQAAFGDLVTDGDTTVNLATNPSVETNLTGWTAGGSVPPTIAQSSAQAKYGTYSLLATWGTGGLFPQVAYAVEGLTVGKTYTISVWAYVPAGSLHVITIVAGTNAFGTETSTHDTWERITWTGVATDPTWSFQVWPLGSPAGGETVYLDGLQIEEGEEATTYVDGTQTGGEWDGIAHQSTSRRLPELPAADLGLAYDALSITNQISATRDGGTAQTAEDSGSVSAYLTRSYTRTDLLMQTDAEALMWAQQIVARTASPELRIASITLKPTRDDRLWAQALGREIGDRVRGVKRPPGGGDPIERDGWVRGVEHQMPVSQEWTTTLVLEQARSQDEVTDTFTRTVSDGWGSADTGEAWTTSGGNASEYAVSSGKGQHTHPAVSVLHACYATLGGPNGSIIVDATVPVLPTGGPITVWAVGRSADTSNYYAAQLSIATSGAVTLVLYKRVSGALTLLTSIGLSGTHAAGDTWRIQFEFVGTTLRAKGWRPASDFEPGSWQVNTTDGSLTSGTQIGLLSRRESGNTNSSPVISWDSLTATTRYTWA